MIKKIITDSGANILSSTILGQKHINVPLSIIIDNNIWLDDNNINIDNFIQAIINTKQKTSTACPSIASWLQAFAGADEIYVVTITSGLSATYDSAIQAANLYKEKYPHVKIEIFDSLSAGPQMRMIAERIAQDLNKNLTFDEVIEDVKQYQQTLQMVFILKDMKNLANNGRVNPTIAKLSKLVNLNIIGTVTDAGTFALISKARGMKKCYPKLLQAMIDRGYNGGKVEIDHVNNLSEAQLVASTITSTFPNADISFSLCTALCTFYAENGGILVSFEK